MVQTAFNPLMECPLRVFPPVYEMHFNQFRWCRLTEVCELVPANARAAGVRFAPSAEELVSRFAALIKCNRKIENLTPAQNRKALKKIFRYSEDGSTLCGKEVPMSGNKMPPYGRFELDISTPYLNSLFVTEEWTSDTLRAIRLGAVAAVHFLDHAQKIDVRLGFPPKENERKGNVTLSGKTVGIVYKIPQCVQ